MTTIESVMRVLGVCGILRRMSEVKLHPGEVTFLEVTDVNTTGAFVDWGMPKELLVPFAEQTCDLHPGDLHPIGLLIDDAGRPFGTMRVRELLTDVGEFRPNEWVQAEAWRQEPRIGWFVIVERRFIGVIPEHEPQRLLRGQAIEARIAQILPDGKIELSLRGLVHEEIEHDAADILHKLKLPPTPQVSDRSSPEQIRAQFDLSKKAFKRAIGRLLKEDKITRDAEGFYRAK